MANREYRYIAYYNILLDIVLFLADWKIKNDKQMHKGYNKHLNCLWLLAFISYIEHV